MKKTILLMLVILITTYANSQTDFICATPENDIPDPLGVYSYSTDPLLYQEGEPLVLNIYYWQVKGPNGEYDGIFNETKVLESVAYLNIAYNPFNIFFKYRGYDSFDSPPDVEDIRYECVPVDPNDPDQGCGWTCNDNYPEPDPTGYGDLDRCQRYNLWDYAVDEGYKIPNAINIYVPYKTNGFGGAASTIGSDLNIVPVVNLIKTSFLHEIGHNLGLRHTTQEWRSPYNPDITYPCHGCERVTRNESDSNYNANCRGDRITDTNAVPNFKREHYYELIDEGLTPEQAELNYIPYNYVNQVSCEYEGSGDDCEETPYTIDHEDVINAMLPALPCDDYYFSPGQGNYMRDTIENLTVLQNTLTDVSELYEPYKGAYYIADPFQTEVPPLFQPGFEYRFIKCSCECPAPADWNENFYYNKNTILSIINKDETDFTSITHPNHSAIWIKHVFNGNEVFPQPQKCYDNYNLKPIGGSVTKFNDDVFNTNVTITQQDSTAINNEYLIQNLESGLYKIEKTYDDGAIQETIIYKGNN